MSNLSELKTLEHQAIEWRHDIHKHPELAYEEFRTGSIVAKVLSDNGIEVHRGVGGTGVVGVLKKGNSPRSIALRADMDALPLSEESDVPYRSVVENKMHACGHDGHTAMLLGAAKLLKDSVDFKGTVFFIFQPAEESLDGATSMIKDGLLEIVTAERFFGMHNWPGLPVGKFAIRVGPMLASFDRFDIKIEGVGGHGALPHEGIDPILISAQVINSLQSIVSRSVNPVDSSVVSVTHIKSGEPSYNVIPNQSLIKGAVRALNPLTRDLVKKRLYELVNGVVISMGGKCEIKYEEVCPVLVNDPKSVAMAGKAASDLVGIDNVSNDVSPVMGSEDFAVMQEKRNGAYILIGNGDGKGSCMIHNPRYDFNDDTIVHGINYWSQLVQNELGT